MIKNAEAMNAIVLSMFGTSVENGLPGLLHIRDRMAERFQDTVIRIAFTSKIIRRIWHERAADSGYRISHPEIPEEIYCICSLEEVIHTLAGEDIHSLIVQTVQVAAAVSEDILTTFSGTITTKDKNHFSKIAFGRPALGVLDSNSYPYTKDIEEVAQSLNPDIAIARQKKAVLFYLGHGNRFTETEKVYHELVMEIQRQYPDIITVMSMVEGGDAVSEIIFELKKHQVNNVILKPFMLVAGDHVRKDMIGTRPGNLKTMLENEGFAVYPVLHGLGEIPEFADIFIQHTVDAARDAGIILR